MHVRGGWALAQCLHTCLGLLVIQAPSSAVAGVMCPGYQTRCATALQEATGPLGLFEEVTLVFADVTRAADVLLAHTVTAGTEP